MSKLRNKLFEYGPMGKILWLIILINVVSFIGGLVYNGVVALIFLIKGLFGRKEEPKVNPMNPWEE